MLIPDAAIGLWLGTVEERADSDTRLWARMLSLMRACAPGSIPGAAETVRLRLLLFATIRSFVVGGRKLPPDEAATEPRTRGRLWAASMAARASAERYSR